MLVVAVVVAVVPFDGGCGCGSVSGGGGSDDVVGDDVAVVAETSLDDGMLIIIPMHTFVSEKKWKGF